MKKGKAKSYLCLVVCERFRSVWKDEDNAVNKRINGRRDGNNAVDSVV